MNAKRRSGMRAKLQGKVFIVPAMLTVVSIFAGFLAIIAAFQGRYIYAVMCVALSLILDGLDGRVARSLNATSEFGRELDSLADVVAFGAAPALMIYMWGFVREMPDFGVLVCFLFLACGAIRLARFNITPSEKAMAYFEGLPIPAAAAALISIIYCYEAPPSGTFALGLLAITTVSLGVLMVSTIPYLSVKRLKITQTTIRTSLAAIAALVALVWYSSKTALVVITLGFALSGPLLLLWAKLLGKREGFLDDDDADIESVA